jgi:predicted ATPase
VAYGSLLVERRTRLHERTARAMEELYADALDEHYGELAHHYGRTDNTPKAVAYLALAGEQAVQRSAYEEAIDQLRRGVELLGTLPETRERAQQELLIQLSLGGALIVAQGYTAPETERAYVCARDLCEQVGEVPQLVRALAGLHRVHLVRAEFERAGELAEQLLSLARETRDPDELTRAHLQMGTTLSWRGELSPAREHLEEAIRRHDPQEYRTSKDALFLGDPRVFSLNMLSWVLWRLGYPDQALARSREAVALARELSHPFSQTFALSYAGRVHAARGEWQAGLELAEALIALSGEHGFPEYAGVGAYLRATILAWQGKLQEGISGMRAVEKTVRARGTVLVLPIVLTVSAEAHWKAGQAEEGLALIAEAQELVAKTGRHAAESEVHRVKGELLLARSPSNPAGAEACFREALEVARRQSAKSYELRAAAGLARLWQQQGRRQDARDLLAPVYAWFTEGFDTKDLRDAKALLEELS